MERQPVTVEDVRQAQDHFKAGDVCNKDKKFREAIEAFTKVVSIKPYEEGHLEELRKKLKEGQYKIEHESIAFMGCAAVHLNQLIQELDEDQRGQVPVDKDLGEVFKDWQ